MPCLLVLVAFFFPRVVIILLAVFTDYMGRAYETLVWPLVGFCFLPFTTLAYAWSMNSYGGVRDIGLAVVVIAVLADIGALGGGRAVQRRRWE